MNEHEINFVESENPFALSIGDLMAALLLIFVLLLSATLLKLQDEFESKTQVAERYFQIKQNLYKELHNEFEADLARWNIEIDSVELSIRFKEPDVLFETNQYEINQQFMTILSSFFPRYIGVLTMNEFVDNIEEIRIEGHTDNTGTYFHNMELSQNRTLSVLNYVLNRTRLGSEEIQWTQERITANGLSYSRPIADNSTYQGRRLNRRVEFRVRTNAEKQVEEMFQIGETY
jgi:outer membrane protein OmpA-like peptidoglycan-associated protein